MMDRSEILSTMNALKLYGMKNAYDEVIATAIKREHQPDRVVSDLLTSEIAEKQARSVKYQMTIAKLPLAKDIDDFDFVDTGSRELPDDAAQCSADWWHRNGKNPLGDRYCASLHP